MKNIVFILIALVLVSYQKNNISLLANPSDYLTDIKTELKKEWPKNRTIN